MSELGFCPRWVLFRPLSAEHIVHVGMRQNDRCLGWLLPGSVCRLGNVCRPRNVIRPRDDSRPRDVIRPGGVIHPRDVFRPEKSTAPGDCHPKNCPPLVSIPPWTRGHLGFLFSPQPKKTRGGQFCKGRAVLPRLRRVCALRLLGIGQTVLGRIALRFSGKSARWPRRPASLAILPARDACGTLPPHARPRAAVSPAPGTQSTPWPPARQTQPASRAADPPAWRPH